MVLAGGLLHGGQIARLPQETAGLLGGEPGMEKVLE